uniref:Uncharacterized protein n=1 Tax=viral metagenome TaxID=1070528 RepID=A0A6C0JXB0_9ZZZZ
MTFVVRKEGQVEKYIAKFLQHETMFCSDTLESDRYDRYCNMPVSPKHNKWFEEITKFYGISTTNKRQKYNWDGKQLDITRTPTFHCMLHEVGHFLMATENKYEINYGLGLPGSGTNVEEDILASIFGIYLEFLVGDDIEITIGDVGVDDQLTPEFLSECFQHYYDLGIINCDGTLFNGTHTLDLS